jgi:hypothetical protein
LAVSGDMRFNRDARRRPTRIPITSSKEAATYHLFLDIIMMHILRMNPRNRDQQSVLYQK